MTSHNVTFYVIGAPYITFNALYQNRNAEFILSVHVLFIFIGHINVIFMRPVYEAAICAHLYHSIIKS